MTTTTKNRTTGFDITLIRYEDGPWVTLVCEEHDLCCDFDSANQAKPFIARPGEWCTECYSVVASKEAN